MPPLCLPEPSLNLNLSRRELSISGTTSGLTLLPYRKQRPRVKGASDSDSAFSALYDFVIQEALDETNPRADYRVTSLEPR
jgi:hypothetical protein